MKNKLALGLTSEQTKEQFPEWFVVKEKIFKNYMLEKWFTGVGIRAEGPVVMVREEEDVARVPVEIDGVSISVIVSGPLRLL